MKRVKKLKSDTQRWKFSYLKEHNSLWVTAKQNFHIQNFIHKIKII